MNRAQPEFPGLFPSGASERDPLKRIANLHYALALRLNVLARLFRSRGRQRVGLPGEGTPDSRGLDERGQPSTKTAVSVFASLLSPYRFVSIHHPSHIGAPFGAYESGTRRDT